MDTERPKGQCGASIVRSVKNAVVRDSKDNNYEHAGVISHTCFLEKAHEEEYCLCQCGHAWRKFK